LLFESPLAILIVAPNAKMLFVPKSYTASNGKLVLTLTPAVEGGFVVTSPLEPELVTEAESIEEAFRMATDALRALRASRTKLLRRLASSRRRSA
jgi:antitoxin HicB